MKPGQVQVGKVYYDRKGRKYVVTEIEARKRGKYVKFDRTGEIGLEKGAWPIEEFASLMRGVLIDGPG